MKNRPKHVMAAEKYHNRGYIFVNLTIVLLIVKLMNLILVLLRPTSIENFVPDSADISGVIITMLWIVSTIVFLWYRTWIGAISAINFCLLSSVSGIRVFIDGYVIWGVWQTLTGILMLVFIVISVVFKSFRKANRKLQGGFK